MRPWHATIATALLLLAGRAEARPRRLVAERFTIPLPAGYRDVSAQYRRDGAVDQPVVLEARQQRGKLRPTLFFQRTPIPGGTLANPALCASTGKSFASDPNTRLVSATIIAGPVGKTCQIHLVAPEGVAIITELNREDETWVMTCNHDDGDRLSEEVCRATLAGFRFRT